MLWGEIFFYSVALKLLSVAFHLQSFDIKSLLLTMIPILHKEYWFTSIYVVLFLLVPVLNSAIHKMTKEKMQICIFVLVFIFSIIPTLIRPFLAEVFFVNDGYSLDWFIILYFVGAYLRLYVDPEKSVKYYFNFYLLFTAITFTSKFLIELVNTYILKTDKSIWNLYQYNSLTVLLAAVFLFLAFTKLNIKENRFAEKVILLLSPCSLAVYLIHLNANWRTWLWDVVVNSSQYYDKVYFIPYIIGSVIAVFAVCCVIDLFRQYIFKIFDTKKFRDKCSSFQNKLFKMSIFAVKKVK